MLAELAPFAQKLPVIILALLVALAYECINSYVAKKDAAPGFYVQRVINSLWTILFSNTIATNVLMPCVMAFNTLFKLPTSILCLFTRSAK